MQWKLTVTSVGVLTTSFCLVHQVFIFSRSEVAPGEYECWGHFAEPWGLKAYVTWMTVAVFLLPALIITICQVMLVVLAGWTVTNCTLHKEPLTRITCCRQHYPIMKRVAWMKFCFVFIEGTFGRHCLITCGGLWLVLCSIPWWIGILDCLPSGLLLYLRKDISRVQLFPLINTALGRPLLRRLLRKSAHSENLLPGSGMYQISAKHRIPDLFSLSDFRLWGLIRLFFKHIM